jgi:hypothetical protein
MSAMSMVCKLWVDSSLTPKAINLHTKDSWGVCRKVFQGKQKRISFRGPCTSQYHIGCLQISVKGYTYYMDSDTFNFKCMIYIKVNDRSNVMISWLQHICPLLLSFPRKWFLLNGHLFAPPPNWHWCQQMSVVYQTRDCTSKWGLCI